MGYKSVRESKKQEKRIRRKRIDKAIAKVNTTPSRVEISGSTAVPTAIIHRIPLKSYAMELLWGFWFWALGFGLGAFFFQVVTFWEILPDVPGWIIIPMGPLLSYVFLLLQFIRKYRPIRIRIHAGTFYFDSWNGDQYKGKVSKDPLELDFSDRFIEDGWVALDTNDEMNQYSRDVFRLNLDDALKLIAFGKANKLDVSVSNEVSRLKKKLGQPIDNEQIMD